MRNLLRNILWLSMMLVLFSCEHRPLEDISNTHYIRVYIDELIRNVTFGFYNEDRLKPEYERLKVLRAVLCDETSGAVVAEHFLQRSGMDENGFYLDGYMIAPPGNYKLMVYNMGTSAVIIGNDMFWGGMYAYTNTVAEYLYSGYTHLRERRIGGDVKYEPEHLFVVSQEQIVLGYQNKIDTIRTTDGQWLQAKSIIDTYYIQVRVKGIRHVMAAVSSLNGFSGSKLLCNGQISQKSITFYFNMHSAEVEPENNTAVIYATFNTFGKLPNEKTMYSVTFEFITSDGRSQTETMDITPMFGTEQVIKNKWILIDKEIEIKPPPQVDGGGFTPSVNEWGNQETEIII